MSLLHSQVQVHNKLNKRASISDHWPQSRQSPELTLSQITEHSQDSSFSKLNKFISNINTFLFRGFRLTLHVDFFSSTDERRRPVRALATNPP